MKKIKNIIEFITGFIATILFFAALGFVGGYECGSSAMNFVYALACVIFAFVLLVIGGWYKNEQG